MQGSDLLERLNAIGQSVAGTSAGLAVLGLGSVGSEPDRLDNYSDLDFFVIVRPGCKDAKPSATSREPRSACLLL